jgi:predicted dehydrogenase
MSGEENRVIRAGVISAGAWSAATHIPALKVHPDVQLSVVTSPDADRAESLRADHGFEASYTDWRLALEHDLDIVIVSSPPIAHADQVVAALRSGAHVLCEKPFAMTRAEAAAMLDAAARYDRRLLVGFGWNHTPIFEQARAVLRSGRVGAVEHVALSLSVNTREMLLNRPVAGWEAGAQRSERQTYQDPSVSAGGAAAVSMSHGFGLLHHLVGEPFDSVFAMTQPDGSRIDLHDAIAARFAGGGTASISCGSAHLAATAVEWYLIVYGVDAQLHVESMHNSLRVVTRDGSVEEPALPPDASDYRPQGPTHALVACARGEDVPAGFSADLGVLTVEDVDAVYDSAVTGRRVSLR